MNWARLLAACCAALILTATTPSHADERRSARFAVLIGSNLGDANIPPLRYAETDSQKIAQTLRSLGGFPADQVVILNGVNATEVRDTLIRLNARLRESPDEAVLFVYYSGHADGDNLQLGGSHFDVQELRALLKGSAAATRVLVVDACRSGSVTRVKGGSPGPSFDVAFAGQPLPQGFAIMTSSAATEDSQESDVLKGSFFSHFFNSALVGAADANADGLVTVSEAFEFASRETNAATQYTKAGPQHPTFRVDWGGRQDLVLTRPSRFVGRTGGLQFLDPGRYVVKSKGEGSEVSTPVAEIASRAGGTMIALQPGQYQVVRRGTDYVLEGDYTVRSGAVERLSSQDMRRYSYAVGVRKGGPAPAAHSLIGAGGVLHDSLVRSLGWQGGLTYRQDRRRFSTELRASFGQSTKATTFLLESTRTQLAGAFIYPWDFSVASVGIGFEIGALALFQSARPRGPAPFLSRPEASPTIVDYQGVPDSESYGVFGGPLLQLDVPLRVRGFLRVELSAPVEHFKRSNSPSATTTYHYAFRALLGLGIYL